MLASSVLDFFKNLRTENELKGGVDYRIDVVGVLLFTAVIEEDIDDFKA